MDFFWSIVMSTDFFSLWHLHSATKLFHQSFKNFIHSIFSVLKFSFAFLCFPFLWISDPFHYVITPTSEFSQGWPLKIAFLWDSHFSGFLYVENFGLYHGQVLWRLCSVLYFLKSVDIYLVAYIYEVTAHERE